MKKDINISGKNIKDYNSEGYRPDLLSRAQRCWEGMAHFREERDRCKRFTYGDQWSDRLPSAFGSVREEDYIISQGNLPLKNNLIRRLVRNVLGVFRNQWAPPQCVARDSAESRQAEVMERLIACNIERNRMEEVYARTMEEFLISGMAVHRKWFGRKGGHTDCWTDFVSPDKFFIDTTGHDFRNWDVALIGEIHEMDFPTLCASFANSDSDFRKLSSLYASAHEAGRRDCRVIEVWSKQQFPRYLCHDSLTGRYFKIEADDYKRMVEDPNERRRKSVEPDEEVRLVESSWVVDEEWHYHFLTPEGYVLAEGRTPYAHGGHPYAMKAYPFIDGEIHSFVADIIDQQKFTNRLISMYDWILRASAKGVLLFPEDALPAGVNMSDIAKEWSRFNGIIVYKPKAGDPLPQQIHSNLSNMGITDLLSIQMNMMEDISGVNGALQGKLDSNSISGTLYNQQTQNSLTALADLLKCYNDFILEATCKDAANIRQFYSPARICSITGDENPFVETDTFFDPSFDFSLREGKKGG